MYSFLKLVFPRECMKANFKQVFFLTSSRVQIVLKNVLTLAVQLAPLSLVFQLVSPLALA